MGNEHVDPPVLLLGESILAPASLDLCPELSSLEALGIEKSLDLRRRIPRTCLNSVLQGQPAGCQRITAPMQERFLLGPLITRDDGDTQAKKEPTFIERLLYSQTA